MSKGGSRSSSGPPREFIQGWQQNLEDARGVAAGMGPQQIAGPNRNHLMGNQLAMQTAMGGPGMQNTAAAAQMAQNIGMGAAGYQPGTMPGQDMSAYMNPYTDQVIDRSMQDLARQRGMAMQGIGDQAAQAGAFGGSRHGVVEGEAHRGFADAAANMSSGLRHQGFDTASGLMQQDMNRMMQGQLQGMNLGLTGANLMGQMGGQQFNQGMQGAQQLGQFGDLFRGIDQQGLDARWMLPQQQQQIRNQAIGLGSGMTTSSSTARPDTMGQLIGAGGAALGGFFMSDRRLKENVVEFGLEPMTGLPWYEFSYLGDPRRFRGVMADDVELVAPGAVYTRDDGYKVVDYDALGIDMTEVAR